MPPTHSTYRQLDTIRAPTQFASIYGWFAEGFGAPDVNDANALFEPLDATPTASAIRSGCGTEETIN